MSEVGLRELRQNASALVRRVEEGEEITITVAGRPSARLVAPQPARWRRWREIEDLFAGPADPEWAIDRSQLEDGLRDPWESR
ncbi:type II toxin-antitoxin system Phd/YefM family antitoxin [Luteococcus sp. Sow4_B9]|uniref:type II toxin-antitoxin system Phd/YefM family antitoxin n=1 Tax=Luteococcus sp. Sow4_B9 TaxID=3438792 RepID=UPI003F9BBA1E